MINARLAIDFNNLGVVLVDEGNLSEALDLFKGASQLMTHVVISQGNSGSDSDDGSSLNVALLDPRVQQAHKIFTACSEDGEIDSPWIGRTGTMDLYNCDNGTPSKSFVCRRAVPIRDDVLPDFCTNSLAVCCSVILYNMAMVYHLSALESVLETTGQKALNLYEMAFSLLPEDDLQIDSVFILQLGMYCLNNMASLHYDLTNWDLSVACTEKLTYLATMMQSKCVSHSLHRESQTFILNAMVLKIPAGAPAA